MTRLLPYRPRHRRILLRDIIARRIAGASAASALLIAAFSYPAELEMIGPADGADVQPAIGTDADPDTGSGIGLARDRRVDDADVVANLIVQNACSRTGLPHGTIPTTAVVADPSGHPSLVSFGTGWKIQTGRRPGWSLLAVCP